MQLLHSISIIENISDYRMIVYVHSDFFFLTASIPLIQYILLSPMFGALLTVIVSDKPLFVLLYFSFHAFFPPKFHFFITFSKIRLLLPVPKESRGSWLKVKGIYKNRNVNIMMGTSIQSVSTSVISNWTFVYHWEHT